VKPVKRKCREDIIADGNYFDKKSFGSFALFAGFLFKIGL
jgi:hypothetical protein